MSRTRILFCCLLVTFAAAGCKAQTPPNSADLSRRIEIQVRSQFNVPPDYVVTLGTRARSEVAGFDAIPITFSRGENRQTVNFLISDDGKTLARLQKFDIGKDPSEIVSSAGRPVRGNPNAKVSLVNFDDLECPYCARMHEELFPATLNRYKDLVRIVYKDYPLTEIHPWALRAAVDSNCLADLSPTAYWNYVDYLHSHGPEVTGADRDMSKAAANLDRMAREQGQREKVDTARLDACLAKQDESTVRKSMKEGEALGIDGTPMVFVNGERLQGALPIEALWAVIDRALLAAGVQPPPPAPAAAATPGAAPSATRKN